MHTSSKTFSVSKTQQLKFFHCSFEKRFQQNNVAIALGDGEALPEEDRRSGIGRRARGV